MHRKKLLLLSALTALAGFVAILVLTLPAEQSTPTAPKDVPISVVMADLRAGTVLEATVNDQNNQVTTVARDKSRKVARYPGAYSAELTKALVAANVKTTTSKPVSQNILLAMLMQLLPILLMVGVLVWIVKSGALTGGVGKFSGKRGQAMGSVPEARFSDVAGCDEAVAELAEMVEFLKDGTKFAALGAHAPRGALLVGPPGTGKTLLARAVAGEAGVPFFALAGSDFVETFVGVGAKRTRDLFDKARATGKAIIFIDEIDAVGRVRSGGSSGGGDGERENTLVSLLNEMDGFEHSTIIVLAATNRSDVLDPALTRPGRLDRQVQVPNPDRAGRTDILRVHTRGKPLAADADLVSLARQTPGMSGADLASLVNESAMEAVRRGRTDLDQACFQAALASVALGRARTSALVTEHDRAITAWHEAGHTLAALLQPRSDNPVSVTIVPRGPAGGVTWMSGSDDVFLPRSKALEQLVVAMSGRAAEEALLNGDYTQGAHGDLASATNLASAMVTKYGMSGFGYQVVDDATLHHGTEVAQRANAEISKLLTTAHEAAAALLATNADFLALLATTLLDEETIDLARINELYGQVLLARAATPGLNTLATAGL